jgi:hypothetical protein
VIFHSYVKLPEGIQHLIISSTVAVESTWQAQGCSDAPCGNAQTFFVELPGPPLRLNPLQEKVTLPTDGLYMFI